VVAGHVGNAALALPLARLGVELLAVPTVLLSNHLGYGRYAGRALPAAEVAALIEGLEAGGFLAGLDGLVTGFLGTVETALVTAEAVARLRHLEPRPLVQLDPVLGDDGRLYAQPGIDRVMRERLLPLADLATPNPFELGCLAGAPAEDGAAQLAAARSLLARGPRGILVTSAAAAPHEAACLLVTPAGAWRLTTPRLSFATAPNGGGDLLAGLLLLETLRQGDLLAAARRAMARLFALLRATQAAGGRELAMVAGQDSLGAAPLDAVAVAALG